MLLGNRALGCGMKELRAFSAKDTALGEILRNVAPLPLVREVRVLEEVVGLEA